MSNSPTLDLSTVDRLMAAIQDLSLARDLAGIMSVVRRAARELTGADGATFVLREGTFCYYAEENAISPLWKGSRFPMSMCISGWVMNHRQSVVIPNIYEDPRIPVDAYRPTFVKSLAMVPIRTDAPIAAIGNYWATEHHATELELRLLQALANSTCVAMENVEILAELERRVKERTLELAAANRELEEKNHELEAFAFTVSHDLRAPLRGVRGFADLLACDSANVLTEESRRHLERIQSSADRMNTLIHDLLSLARLSTAAVQKTEVDLGRIFGEVVETLARDEPGRKVEVRIAANATARCDPGLLRIALENLAGNAWKFTSRQPDARIEFGFSDQGDFREFFVRDNGAGFAAQRANRLFVPFQRLHTESDFPGVGIGLATVRRIIVKHGGDVRAEGKPGEGATFTFTLPILTSG